MTRTLPATRVAQLVGDFDRRPAYKGLAEGLRALITDGRVPTGVRLPSERELTAALGVSRTTVARAYAELRERGYLRSRQGSGSVAHLPAPGLRGDHLLPPGDVPEDAPEHTVDLTCAAPSPAPGLLAAYEKAVEQLPGYLAGTGYYPSGLPLLREAVAASYDARGLPTDPGQVLVVPGALAGVAVAARCLLAPGRRVVLESPTYPNAIANLRGSGARLVGADASPGADRAAEVAHAVAEVRPALAYLVPDFHNPTGHLLDDEGRARVAAALGRTRTTAVVDETLAMLALDPVDLPAPLAAHAPDAITVGSLSKPYWGGLRVGWIRAPHDRVEALLRARLALDLGVPVLEQLVAAELLVAGGGLLEHRIAQLRESREVLLGALRERLPEWQVQSPSGGLNLWCELPAPLSSALASRAIEHDVLLAPGPSFAPEGGLDRYLRVPFTQPAHVLEAAVGRLAVAWRETVDESTGGTGGTGRGRRPSAKVRRSEPTLVA